MSRLPRPGDVLPGSAWLETLALLAARHRRRHTDAVLRQRAGLLHLGGSVGRWILADPRPPAAL